MAKHHKEASESIACIDNPEVLIRSIVKNEEEQEWVVSEVLYGGPKHKQAYSALLLQRMYQLTGAIAKHCGTSFSVQQGINLTSKEGWEIPVPLVLSAAGQAQQQEAADLLAHAPAHEIIAFNTLLQAIEWSIAALRNSAVQDE